MFEKNDGKHIIYQVKYNNKQIVIISKYIETIFVIIISFMCLIACQYHKQVYT